MTSELMRDFGISAGQLGNLAAFYFYAYLLMQIPTGVLVDSWGARRLLIVGSLLAAAGCVIFGRRAISASRRPGGRSPAAPRRWAGWSP